MNKLYILDFLISSIIAGINIKYTKTTDYKILVGIIWTIFIISSLLLNYSFTVYFISSIIIGFSVLAIYIILKIPILSNLTIVFWMFYFISALIITFIIVSKKMFFANVYNEPLMGAKGENGKLGSKGESYILKTYPEKCYNDLILTVEDYLVQNMKINDIDYDPYEYQLKNLYFKQLLKRICLSREFNDYVLGKHDNQKSYNSDEKEYNNNICNYDKELKKRRYGNTHEKCVTDRYEHDYQKTSRNVRSENNYNKIMKELKIIVIKWCKYILLNNDNEDNDLKKKLGYNRFVNINNLIPIIKSDNHNIINNNLREDMRYNNKTGRKFFDDYFLTDKYFDEFLSKNNNKRDNLNNQPEYRSFSKIENTSIVIETLDLGKPFNWGKSGPSTKCGK